MDLCDVTIEVENQYLSAHRSVLVATNCQKLKEAIEQSREDSKNQKSHLRFVNLPIGGVIAFLDFIYTGYADIR
jgi:ferritin-like metal-binding protein YciE